jgi:hypothetical protein
MLLLGETDGGRLLTLVVEPAHELGTWSVLTGAPDAEMIFIGHNDIDRWLRERREQREAKEEAEAVERQRA